MDFDKYRPLYIKNVNKEEADIFIFDVIGMGGISGQDFADEIKMLNDFGVKQINVHINSGGGSVIDGFSIFSAMTNSDATIHTINEGLAGSMAGIILLAGDKVSMMDFASVMVHNVKGSENPDTNEQKAIDALQEALVTIVKNRTNKNKDQATKMMNVETWLNAKEALAAGFIDEIVSSKHKEKKNLTRQNVLEIQNILNQADPKKDTTMKTVCDYLNLSQDATEPSILEAIKKIAGALTSEKEAHETTQGKLTTSEKLVDTQAEKIGKIETAEKATNEKLVEEAVDSAIKEKKVDAKQKDALVAQFKDNYKGLKVVLGAFKATAPKLVNQLEDNTDDETTSDFDVPEKQKDWTFREWDKGDEEGLKNMKEQDLDMYKKLYKAQYKVDFTED